MRTGTHLIVMAKLPLPGQVKTRLAPVLGAAGAARLAERFLRETLARACASGVGSVELNLAPHARHRLVDALRARHEITVTEQGEGDLGQRMARALGRALRTQRAALLVGTDIPALTAAMLQEAAAALATHDAVFVPTLDGGYALVGLRRFEPALFEGIAWSTGQVMAQTRAALGALGLRHYELPPVCDVDEPGDLVHVPAGWLADAGS